jgi:hypothetical protein
MSAGLLGQTASRPSSIVIADDLLVEGVGVKGAGGTGDSGDD